MYGKTIQLFKDGKWETVYLETLRYGDIIKVYNAIGNEHYPDCVITVIGSPFNTDGQKRIKVRVKGFYGISIEEVWYR